MTTSTDRPSVSTGMRTCSRQNSAGMSREASGWMLRAEEVEEADAELQAERHRQGVGGDKAALYDVVAELAARRGRFAEPPARRLASESKPASTSI